MAIYSLGPFTFFNLESTLVRGGAPQTVRETAVLVQRPGVAGTGFIQTGVKGMPFQMRSVVDVLTVAAAQVLIVNYEAVINKGLLALVHASLDYTLTPVSNWYWPLEVIPTWRRVSCATGGLNNGSVLVEAFWTLQPVYVAPEEEEE